MYCEGATSCQGTAELTVARRSGRGHDAAHTHLVLAEGLVSLPAGSAGTIVLRITRSGQAILGRRAHYSGFRVTLRVDLDGQQAVVSIRLSR